MTKSEKKNLREAIVPNGFCQEENNLPNIPFTLLSHQARANNHFGKDMWYLDSKGSKQRYRVDIGTAGTPTYITKKVYMALTERAYLAGFEDETVYCTQYEILKILGWSVCQANYKKLRKHLDILGGIWITASFFQFKGSKGSTHYACGILDYYQFKDEGRHRKKKDSDYVDYFRFNKEFFKSIKSDNLKLFNTKVWRALKSPLAMELYHYTDKHLATQERYQIELTRLAYVHFGMAECKHYQLIKQFNQAIEKVNAIKNAKGKHVYHLVIKPGKSGDILHFQKLNQPDFPEFQYKPDRESPDQSFPSNAIPTYDDDAGRYIKSKTGEKVYLNNFGQPMDGRLLSDIIDF